LARLEVSKALIEEAHRSVELGLNCYPLLAFPTVLANVIRLRTVTLLPASLGHMNQLRRQGVRGALDNNQEPNPCKERDKDSDGAHNFCYAPASSYRDDHTDRRYQAHDKKRQSSGVPSGVEPRASGATRDFELEALVGEVTAE
jgi:hypothetical protein